MADSFIAIDEPSTVDKKLDTFQLAVGANTVERERVIIAGEGATDLVLPVLNGATDAGSPLKIGGRASAAAPSSVSSDGDRVNGWFLRNGAQAAVITAAGALIGGDATNGLDVDVTRLPALVAGSANIGDVDIASVQKAATATLTSVNDTASSTTLLSATAGRLGLILYNDSTVACYVKFGTTASTTSFTKRMVPGETWDLTNALHVYTGRIDAIWASDASGAMRITELTA